MVFWLSVMELLWCLGCLLWSSCGVLAVCNGAVVVSWLSVMELFPFSSYVTDSQEQISLMDPLPQGRRTSPAIFLCDTRQ